VVLAARVQTPVSVSWDPKGTKSPPPKPPFIHLYNGSRPSSNPIVTDKDSNLCAKTVVLSSTCWLDGAWMETLGTGGLRKDGKLANRTLLCDPGQDCRPL
jgi:hypothetical protein